MKPETRNQTWHRRAIVPLLCLTLGSLQAQPLPLPEPFQLRISLRNNDVTLHVTGPRNELFVLESSADLANWTIIGTNTVPGPARELDLGLASLGQAFFRPRVSEDTAGCGTFVFSRLLQQRSSAADSCPVHGPPDDPVERTMAIPSLATPVKTLRLMFHILADDNSGPAASIDQVDASVATMNQHFLPWRIQFSHCTRIVGSNAFRFLDSPQEERDMKKSLGIEPRRQLNIFVTKIRWNSYSAYSIFPWNLHSLTPLDGTIIDGPLLGLGRTALTHEIGHALGLYHTHHGVAEVEEGCFSPCYEPADGTNGDTAGDRCSDTPATPLMSEYPCVPPTGTAYCSYLEWSSAGYMNFMSYIGCRSEFTPQQAGRMHAWISHRLYDWLDTLTPAAPSDLAASSLFTDVQLSWRDNSGNETTFNIERTVGQAPWGELATVGANVTSFTDRSVQPLTAYRYRVRAFNNATPSPYSFEATITTPDVPDTFYVDSRNFSPPFNGTLADPFQTVRQAHDGITRLATLRIEAGTYPETFELNKILLLEPRGGDVLLGTP